VLLAKAFAL
jgi:hypothetical protein